MRKTIMGTCETCGRAGVSLMSAKSGNCFVCHRVLSIIHKVKNGIPLAPTDLKYLANWKTNPHSVGGSIFHKLMPKGKLVNGTAIAGFPERTLIPIWVCSDGSEYGSESEALRKELELCQRELRKYNKRRVE